MKYYWLVLISGCFFALNVSGQEVATDIEKTAQEQEYRALMLEQSETRKVLQQERSRMNQTRDAIKNELETNQLDAGRVKPSDET